MPSSLVNLEARYGPEVCSTGIIGCDNSFYVTFGRHDRDEPDRFIPGKREGLRRESHICHVSLRFPAALPTKQFTVG